MIMEQEGVLQIHGFYADLEKKTVNLDVILDFALEDRQTVMDELRAKAAHAFPDYEICMAMDIDI